MMLSVESFIGVSLNHELARKRPFSGAVREDRWAVDTGLIPSPGDDFENGKHKLASTTKQTSTTKQSSADLKQRY